MGAPDWISFLPRGLVKYCFEGLHFWRERGGTRWLERKEGIAGLLCGLGKKTYMQRLNSRFFAVELSLCMETNASCGYKENMVQALMRFQVFCSGTQSRSP